MEEAIKQAHNQPYAGRFLDNSYSQEKQGYPQALATLRTWPMDQLRVEEREMLKASFGKMFQHAAEKALGIVRQVIKERQAINQAKDLA